jgi:perosamine synthetase
VTGFAVPVYQPDLSGNERAYVLECLDSTWISSKGRFIGEFESAFARQVGAAHAISVCNGTVALHLALAGLGIGPGDEVLVPTLTYVASVNAIRYVGATPVFVDALPDTWQMDPAAARASVTARTRAVLAVHLYGGACDLAALSSLCAERELHLVEDCAEGIGTRHGGRHVGVAGAVGTFSFFGNKTLTTGEGGMLVCADPALAENLRRLRGQGLVPGCEYWHDRVGYNYRMTNICAAIGLAQIERIDEILERKRALAALYHDALRGSGLEFQHFDAATEPGHWMVSVLAKDAAQRARLREALAAAGVETRPLFAPVHRMPMYAAPGAEFPVADDLAARGINLPSWHRLDEAQVAFIASIVRGALEQRACA